MPDSTDRIRPPQDIAWTPSHGWMYEDDEVTAAVEDVGLVLTVSSDGTLRDAQPRDRAPLGTIADRRRPDRDRRTG